MQTSKHHIYIVIYYRRKKMELLPPDSSSDDDEDKNSTMARPPPKATFPSPNAYTMQADGGKKRKKDHVDEPLGRQLPKRHAGTKLSYQPEEQSNRIRSFPHVHGQWACSIFLPLENDTNFQSLRESALKNNCKEIINMNELIWEIHENEFHISLSKEFVLRKHQIDTFVEAVKKNIQSRFHIYNMSLTDECIIHTNPECTRSFIGLIAHGGTENTTSIIESLNHVMDKFSLSKYYKDPSIHVSIASAVGNIKTLLKNNLSGNNNCKWKEKIKYNTIDHTVTDNNDVVQTSNGFKIISSTNNEDMLEMSIIINHLIVKTGHILHKIYLK